MQVKDPKGYYTQLGVAHTASATEIKQAFRRLALHVHPDRNTSASAEETFKQLVQAYDVLSHPAKRSAYDAQCIDLPKSTPSWSGPAAVPQPIVCTVCGRIPIQPKYVIFYEVKSFLWTSFRIPIQGIYCRKCADKRVLRATCITWLLGWWGLPWGPLYTLQALLQNLLGGRRPSETNARILGYQARYFASIGRMFLARSLATMALELSTEPGLSTSLKPFLSPSGEPSRHRPRHRLKNEWEWRGSAFLLQGVFLVCIIAAVILLFAGGEAPLQSPSVASKQVHEPGHLPPPVVPAVPQAAATAHAVEGQSPEHVAPKPLQKSAPALTNAWHVTADAIRLRAGPGLAYSVIGVLERFDTVTVQGKATQGEWIPVQTGHGTEGFVSQQYLTAGNGTTAKRQWCQERQNMPTPNHIAPGQSKKRAPDC